MAVLVKQPCDEGVILSKETKSPCAPNAAPWVLTATILGPTMASSTKRRFPWRCTLYNVPWERPRSMPNG